MSDNIHYLHGKPSQVGHFLRVGKRTRQVETLLAAGCMPVNRFVLNGSRIGSQKDLIISLQERGSELILDTQVDELSSLGRWDSSAKSAPWAHPDGMLLPEHFSGKGNHDAVGLIASFAVENQMNAVLAPTHLLGDANDGMFEVDKGSCIRLRERLDRDGGSQIGIDYALSITYASLRDSAQRRALIRGLRDLPFVNLWLRVSPFGSDAEAPKLRKYISAVADFLALEKPIIADKVGGLTGLAIAGFGSVGGYSHGLIEQERFDGSGWSKIEPKRRGGGSERRVFISGLDRLIPEAQFKELMSIPNGRRILCCNDPNCCPNGYQGMLDNPTRHFITQRAEQIRKLNLIPDLQRPRHFLETELRTAARLAKQATKLRFGGNGELQKVATKASERLDKLLPTLEDLYRTQSGELRSLQPLSHNVVKTQSKKTDR
jgi:hypothetical protein